MIGVIPGSVSWPSDDRQRDRNAFIQGRMTNRFSHIYTLNLSLKGAYDDIFYTSTYGDSRYGQTEIQINSSHSFQLKRWWKFSVAADVHWDGLVSDNYDARRLSTFAALASSFVAAVTCSILRALCKEPLRTGRILNINVPDLPLDQIKGIRVTRCGTRHPADQVIPQQDPRGNTLYWIGPPGGKCDAGPS
mgnify:CR=1 FL=1